MIFKLSLAFAALCSLAVQSSYGCTIYKLKRECNNDDSYNPNRHNDNLYYTDNTGQSTWTRFVYFPRYGFRYDNYYECKQGKDSNGDCYNDDMRTFKPDCKKLKDYFKCGADIFDDDDDECRQQLFDRLADKLEGLCGKWNEDLKKYEQGRYVKSIGSTWCYKDTQPNKDARYQNWVNYCNDNVRHHWNQEKYWKSYYNCMENQQYNECGGDWANIYREDAKTEFLQRFGYIPYNWQ